MKKVGSPSSDGDQTDVAEMRRRLECLPEKLEALAQCKTAQKKQPK
ncbi:hypothetical protein ICN48_13655 [Polynucleobacter sp. JS-Safj-400b-B2]|nr:hypothetical protein [Polynucleobacter sp. JS-Safj-400b-B2]MBU3627272.1 hypothetical protein [Polynucleobacter sp. JS-Safj-400b-B2]